MLSPASTPERTLRRLDWTIVRRLDGLLQGDYRTVFRGQGLDLADIREYVPGDDVRNIDWNVTARLDVPHVREYLEDREITAHFLLDLSPSVDFGTASALKRDLLVDFVGLVARLLTRHGNRVGAILYGRQVEKTVPARGGRIQVLRLIDEVQRRPRLESSPATSLAELIETALRSIKRRSLVFIVSDFFTMPGWEKPLGLLARRHETLAIRLTDPRERELPDIGFVIMTDAETGETLHIDTHDARFRRRFAEVVDRRERALGAAFRRAGVDTLELSTEEDLVRAVVRFAATRKLRYARQRSMGRAS
ncbi:MAG TPA: DUF58 domain-containing protein [Candidatus Limnocylindria bacterium]|jgi:uncharacterized protein (DUF58 family)|nr:DUF58 domain-containing protein [Candidatus Limnocylindria bacterium]